MERISRLSGKNKKTGGEVWQFTEEEKEDLRDILEGHAQEREVEAFIQDLEYICDVRVVLSGHPEIEEEEQEELLGQPKKAEVRKERGDILKGCEKALEHLRRIHMGETYLIYAGTVDYYMGEDTGDNFMSRLEDAEAKAYEPLKEFVRVLGEYHRAEVKKGHRNKAGTDHFAEKIIEIFVKHIKIMPTVYKSGASHTGKKIKTSLFPDILSKVYEMVGIKQYTDLSKTIKAVIKAYHEKHPSK